MFFLFNINWSSIAKSLINHEIILNIFDFCSLLVWIENKMFLNPKEPMVFFDVTRSEFGSFNDLVLIVGTFRFIIRKCKKNIHDVKLECKDWIYIYIFFND